MDFYCISNKYGIIASHSTTVQDLPNCRKPATAKIALTASSLYTATFWRKKSIWRYCGSGVNVAVYPFLLYYSAIHFPSKNKEEFKLSKTLSYHLLVCADNVNYFCENIKQNRAKTYVGKYNVPEVQSMPSEISIRYIHV
jgi:hypothetical protein